MRTVTQTEARPSEVTAVIPAVIDPRTEYRGKHALDNIPERFDLVASMTVTNQLFKQMLLGGAR